METTDTPKPSLPINTFNEYSSEKTDTKYTVTYRGFKKEFPFWGNSLYAWKTAEAWMEDIRNQFDPTKGTWEFEDVQVSNGYRIFRFKNFSGSFQQWASDSNTHANAEMILKAVNLHNRFKKLLAVAHQFIEAKVQDDLGVHLGNVGNIYDKKKLLLEIEKLIEESLPNCVSGEKIQTVKK